MPRLWAGLILIGGAARLGATPDWVRYGQMLRDAQGNIYVAGSVTTDIVPASPRAFETNFYGGVCGHEPIVMHGVPVGDLPIPCTEGFAAKISADGVSLLYATYLGGMGFNSAAPIGFSASGNLLLRFNTSR